MLEPPEALVVVMVATLPDGPVVAPAPPAPPAAVELDPDPPAAPPAPPAPKVAEDMPALAVFKAAIEIVGLA